MKRALFYLLVILAGFRTANAAVLTVEATTGTVRVTGVKPRGSIILFSCSRSYRDGRAYLNPAAITLRDTIGAGVIEYKPAGGIPLRSVFAAIDEETGLATFASHRDFPLSVIPFRAEKLSKDETGEIVRLTHDMPRLIVLLARPSKGAWLLRGIDGQNTDRDRTAGHLALAFEDFQPIAGSEKGPKNLKQGDVIVAIDPSHLDIYTAEVGK